VGTDANKQATLLFLELVFALLTLAFRTDLWGKLPATANIPLARFL
jgi:hypothetical protein